MKIALTACALAAGLAMWAPANALTFGRRAPASAATPSAADSAVAQVQQALDEKRLLDADRMLTEAALSGYRDARLTVLDGELDIRRGHYADSLTAFREAEKTPALQARALQDEGIALSLLGRSDEAMAALQQAVAKDASLWRAWNALGSEYDARHRWPDAEAAYERALAASNGAAIVLNNRGYSRLMQNRRDAAMADLVAALKKQPDFAEARTNLRLAMAMGGEYDRAIAGGSSADQAALLNNAGFAAAMRGDYATAQTLLNRAIKAKGEYYAKASDNLRIIQALLPQAQKAPDAAATP
jgi:Flp pilus assembly protein TadD